MPFRRTSQQPPLFDGANPVGGVVSQGWQAAKEAVPLLPTIFGDDRLYLEEVGVVAGHTCCVGFQSSG